MKHLKVFQLRARDVCHPWSGAPYFNLPKPAPGFYSTQVHVDPFPAYPHDVQLVMRELRKVARAFPIGVPVSVNVLEREGPERTNGHCEIVHDYQAKKKPAPWSARIVLWGKRIPPHPAMTRYLVAHEYGHAVAQFLARKLRHKDAERLYREYRSFRPVRRRPRYYGGGTWHASSSELFANDFRILVAGVEPEFWPHPGFARPERVAAVRRFWKEHAP